MSILLAILFVTSVNQAIGLPFDTHHNNNVFHYNFETNDSNAYEASPNIRLLSDEDVDNSEVCTDFYSYSCNRNTSTLVNNYNFDKKLRQTYSSIVKHLIEVLSTPPTDEKNSLNIERQLYQNCMNLGKENDDDSDDEDNNEPIPIGIIFEKMLKHFNLKIDQKDWKSLDEELSLSGFKHTFFDVSAVEDPLNKGKYVILESNYIHELDRYRKKKLNFIIHIRCQLQQLSPPSVKEWNSKKLSDILSDIYVNYQLRIYEICTGESKKTDENESGSHSSKSDSDSSKHDSEKIKHEEESIEGPAFIESDENPSNSSVDDSQNDDEEKNGLCSKIKGYSAKELSENIVFFDNSEVLELFDDLLKAMFDPIDVSNRKTFNKRLTVEAWIEKYNSAKPKQKIDWLQVFNNQFKRFNISIDVNDIVIVRNQPYFLKLAKILNGVTNKILVHAVQSKFVASNVRYFAWDWAHSLNPIDKTAFCLEESGFYAASSVVMHSIQDELTSNLDSFDSVLRNIVETVDDNILKDKGITKQMKTVLKNRLEKVLEILFFGWERTLVWNYYDDFNFTGDYMVDSNRFHNFLKDNILRRLHSGTLAFYEIAHFSILEKDSRLNRFTLYTVMSALISKSIFEEYDTEKEIQYATFGVNIARYLYTLLTEDNLDSDLMDRRGFAWLVPHSTYSSKKVKCFIPDNIVQYGYPSAYATIREIFSVRFAYEALQKDSQFYEPLKRNYQSYEALPRDSQSISPKKFFETYTSTQCHSKEGKIVRRVLENVDEFASSFGCERNEVEKKKCKAGPF